MKVYYNSSLWGQERGISGRIQKIDLEFNHNGLKRIIPNIYHFPKGMVFDILTIVNKEDYYNFYEKYKDIEDNLTSQERRIAEQEHPYQSMDIKDIWINGERLKEGYSASSYFHIEGLEENQELEYIKNGYSNILKGEECFACSRYLIPYPRKSFTWNKILQYLRLYKLKNIKFNTHPMMKFYPLNIEFEMDKEVKEVSFQHPITEIEYSLYFQDPTPIEIQNLYLLQAMYEIEPGLPEGSKLQFDSSIEYSGRPTSMEYSPNAASSIGIIGGADGPTAIFLSGKEKNKSLGLKGLPLHNALSLPSFEKEERYKFLLEGINIRSKESEEYEFNIK